MPQTENQAQAYAKQLAEAVRSLKEHRDQRDPLEPLEVPDDLDTLLDHQKMRLYQVERMKRDPMEAVLEQEIREIGWMIYAHGGKALMHKAMRATALLMGEELGSYAETVLDGKWSMIGVGRDTWTP